MGTDSSWWLKFKRAQYHMFEIDRVTKRYLRTHPYEVVRIAPSKSKHSHWIFKLKITAQPDVMLPLMIGDFFHNLRSALDHLFVATLPGDSGLIDFPIVDHDLWAQDSSGIEILKDDPRRKSYESAVAHLDDVVEASFRRLQPYHHGIDADLHILSIIRRLDNTDKHRRLLLLTPGVMHLQTTITARDEPASQTTSPLTVHPDGTEVAHFRWLLRPPLQESEVKVESRGTPLVVLRMIGDQNQIRNHALRAIMLKATREVRRMLTSLEPLTKS